MITETHIQLINDRYKYDGVNGGLINIATGVQNKGTSVGGTYKQIKVSDLVVYVHKVVWMMHNNWQEPKGVIDHINGNSLDNRIENLRDVSHTENMINRSNASKYGKWVLKQGNGYKVVFVHKGVE